jgi:hypothetical protein
MVEHVSEFKPPPNPKWERKRHIRYINGVPLLINYKQLWDEITNTWEYLPMCSRAGMIRLCESFRQDYIHEGNTKMIEHSTEVIESIKAEVPATIIDVTDVQMTKRQRKRRAQKLRKEQQSMEQSVESLLIKFKAL